MRKLTIADELEIIKQYASGLSTCAIAKHRNISNVTIWSALRRNDIKLRSKKDQCYTLFINHNAFDDLTPEAAYWAGYLAADGCLRSYTEKRKNAEISAYAQERDVCLLREFKTWLGSEHALTDRIDKKTGTRGKCFAFSSKNIYDRLISLGITPRKSHTLVVDPVLANSIDFWRGAVDGDGWISIITSVTRYRQNGSLRETDPYQYLIAGLATASPAFAGQFIGFVRDHIPEYNVAYEYHLVNPEKPTRHGISGACRINGSKAIKLLNILYYKDCYHALPRKMEKAIEAMQLDIRSKEENTKEHRSAKHRYGEENTWP